MTGNQIEIKNDLAAVFTTLANEIEKRESRASYAAGSMICSAFLSVRFSENVVFEENEKHEDKWQKRYDALRTTSANHAAHDVARGCYHEAIKTLKQWCAPVNESGWMLVGLFIEVIFTHAFSEKDLTWEQCQEDLKEAYGMFLKIVSPTQEGGAQ